MPEESAVRPFWSGTITFGLVGVPIDLFAATRSGGAPLRMIGPRGEALRREFHCPADGRALDRDEIVRGYEIEEGEFVEVTDEELEKLEPRKSREIDLRTFVDRRSIDPLFFERPYFLAPSGDTQKAYRLLATTMERTGRAGIATFVMRDREYLIAIFADRGMLHGETLRFADELRSAQTVELPEKTRIPTRKAQSVDRAIAKLFESKVATEELRDGYAARLEELARKKRRSDEVVRLETAEPPEEAAESKVVDLMRLLKARLGGGSTRPAGRKRSASGRRAGQRRKARKTGKAAKAAKTRRKAAS